jgi:phosphoserine phosphatase
MAFWDFDGTIIKGDISVGLYENGKEIYAGLFEKAADAGFTSRFADGPAASQFIKTDYRKMGNIVGKWLSWPSLGQLFHGADADKLEEFCRRYAETKLKGWYFASSMKILRALDAAGVENHIVSGSPDLFVKGAGAVAGIPRARALGIRQRIAGGRVTTKLVYPLSMNEGKVECIRETLTACPQAVAVAAFGNSYWTDGPFMRYVVTTPLPGGAKATALMINGGEVPAEYAGLFRCVTQDEVQSEKTK